MIGSDISLEWEGRQLVKYTDSDKTITYKYNDAGYRIYKKVIDNFSSNYDEYIYTLNGDQVLYEEINHFKNNVLSTDHIYYTYGADGKLISMNLNDTEYFYIRNIQGDIVKIVDENANLMVEYYYDAWGNILDKVEYDSDGNVIPEANHTIAKLNPYRYRGYRYDEETSLYYLSSRYYNPEMGRFINADGLIGETGDLLAHNMYAYCQNNPVMYADPSGYFIITAIVITGIIIGATAGGIIAHDIAKENGAEGWELAGWTAVGIVGGGAVGGLLGYWAAPSIAGTSWTMTLGGGSLALAGGGSLGGGIAVTVTGAQVAAVGGGLALTGGLMFFSNKAERYQPKDKRRNTTQNNEFDRLCNEYGCNHGQRERVHRKISKKGFTSEDIIDVILEVLGR